MESKATSSSSDHIVDTKNARKGGIASAFSFWKEHDDKLKNSVSLLMSKSRLQLAQSNSSPRSEGIEHSDTRPFSSSQTLERSHSLIELELPKLETNQIIGQPSNSPPIGLSENLVILPTESIAFIEKTSDETDADLANQQKPLKVEQEITKPPISLDSPVPSRHNLSSSNLDPKSETVKSDNPQPTESQPTKPHPTENQTTESLTSEQMAAQTTQAPQTTSPDPVIVSEIETKILKQGSETKVDQAATVAHASSPTSPSAPIRIASSGRLFSTTNLTNTNPGSPTTQRNSKYWAPSTVSTVAEVVPIAKPAENSDQIQSNSQDSFNSTISSNSSSTISTNQSASSSGYAISGYSSSVPDKSEFGLLRRANSRNPDSITSPHHVKPSSAGSLTSNITTRAIKLPTFGGSLGTLPAREGDMAANIDEVWARSDEFARELKSSPRLLTNISEDEESKLHHLGTTYADSKIPTEHLGTPEGETTTTLNTTTDESTATESTDEGSSSYVEDHKNVAATTAHLLEDDIPASLEIGIPIIVSTPKVVSRSSRSSKSSKSLHNSNVSVSSEPTKHSKKDKRKSKVIHHVSRESTGDDILVDLASSRSSTTELDTPKAQSDVPVRRLPRSHSSDYIHIVDPISALSQSGSSSSLHEPLNKSTISESEKMMVIRSDTDRYDSLSRHDFPRRDKALPSKTSATFSGSVSSPKSAPLPLRALVGRTHSPSRSDNINDTSKSSKASGLQPSASSSSVRARSSTTVSQDGVSRTTQTAPIPHYSSPDELHGRRKSVLSSLLGVIGKKPKSPKEEPAPSSTGAIRKKHRKSELLSKTSHLSFSEHDLRELQTRPRGNSSTGIVGFGSAESSPEAFRDLPRIGHLDNSHLSPKKVASLHTTPYHTDSETDDSIEPVNNSNSLKAYSPNTLKRRNSYAETSTSRTAFRTNSRGSSSSLIPEYGSSDDLASVRESDTGGYSSRGSNKGKKTDHSDGNKSSSTTPRKIKNIFGVPLDVSMGFMPQSQYNLQQKEMNTPTRREDVSPLALSPTSPIAQSPNLQSLLALTSDMIIECPEWIADACKNLVLRSSSIEFDEAFSTATPLSYKDRKLIRRSIEDGSMDIAEEMDVTLVSQALLMYLEELPDPVCTSAHYPDFVYLLSVDDPKYQLQLAHRLIWNLPHTHRSTLKYLVDFLSVMSNIETDSNDFVNPKLEKLLAFFAAAIFRHKQLAPLPSTPITSSFTERGGFMFERTRLNSGRVVERMLPPNLNYDSASDLHSPDSSHSKSSSRSASYESVSAVISPAIADLTVESLTITISPQVSPPTDPEDQEEARNSVSPLGIPPLRLPASKPLSSANSMPSSPTNVPSQFGRISAPSSAHSSPRSHLPNSSTTSRVSARSQKNAIAILEYLVLHRKQLFSLHDEPTAVFAISDLQPRSPSSRTLGDKQTHQIAVSSPGTAVLEQATIDYIFDMLANEFYEERDFAEIAFTTLTQSVSIQEIVVSIMNRIKDGDPQKDYVQRRALHLLSHFKTWIMDNASLILQANGQTDIFTIIQEHLKTSPDNEESHLLTDILSELTNAKLQLTNLGQLLSPPGSATGRSSKKYLDPLPLQSPIVPIKISQISSLSASAVAENLTIISSEHLKDLKFRSALNSKLTDFIHSKEFVRISNYFNSVSKWVQYEIISRGVPSSESLEKNRLKECANQMIWFTSLATNLVKMGNFNGALSVYTGITAISVSRLTKIFEKAKKHCGKQLDALTELFSMTKNHKNYQNALKAHGLPSIPLILLIARNISSMEENNPSFDDDKWNVGKIRDYCRIVSEFKKHQKSVYYFHKDQSLYNALVNLNPPSEDEIYQTSLKVEAKK